MNQVSPRQLDALLAAPEAGPVCLIGAGGCGMSGLGHLLLDAGLSVTGSDVRDNDSCRSLRARGAVIQAGHHAKVIKDAPPRLVVYSSAVPLDNPVLAAAEQRGVPIVRRARLLAALMRRQRGVCVAGMHGKTTTTALLAYALDRLGLSPSFAVGAEVPQLSRQARWVEAVGERWFVAEADESDGTLGEFHPDQAILLNVDEEHMDYFAGLDDVCREFAAFAGQVREQVWYCADDPRLVSLMAGVPGAVSFGFNPGADYRVELAADTRGRTGAYFFVWHGGARLGGFYTRLLGEKNASNAAAVVAFLHGQGFAATDIARALAEFRGAARRQEELHRDAAVRVFDDYGHHPREVSATLRAIRELGAKRVLAAFQPHRYTRTRHFLKEFSTCFGDADRLWVTEVYAASEEPIPDIDGQRLAEEVARQGGAVEFASTLADLRAQVRVALQPGDVVVFLGAGDITVAAHQLAAELSMKLDEHFETLADLLAPGTVLRRDELMAKRTTLRVGGPADIFVEPQSEADVGRVARYCAEAGLPCFVLGRGSNLLVRDGGIRGVVLSLMDEALARVEVKAGGRLECGAGARLNTVAAAAKQAGIGGLEFMEGIPGCVGGALRMNAGAMGAVTFDVVESLRTMDVRGKVREWRREEVEVEYRSCPMLAEHIALGAVFCGQEARSEDVGARMKEFSLRRHGSQPKARSAGCIFKNPTECPAGRLVDEMGLKGLTVGGARVSVEHGNFIINDGTATAEDVLRLIGLIQERAEREQGVRLQTEVRIVGENPKCGIVSG